VTGGRVRFKQFQVDGYRKLGFPDDAIQARFVKFWEERGHTLDVRIVSRYFHKMLGVAAMAMQESTALGVQDCLPIG
jgi:hypothetical protein